MPTKRLAPALRDLGSKYGELTYMNMLGQPMVILNSYDAAIKLLEGRSANTSDRPRMVMAELTGYMREFAIQGYTPGWRLRRRTFHGFFQQSVVPNYYPVHLRECHRVLNRLLDTPEDFIAFVRHMFAATIMDIVYGIEVAEQNDPYVALAERATKIFSDMVIPGQYIVELLPFLKHVPSWLPGAGFKRDAERWSKDIHRVWNEPYEASVDALAQGTARPCVVTSLVEEAMQRDGKISPEDDECFRDVTGLAYLTGADTTLSAVQAFFLAMVQYPEVRKKAQQELDTVVGPDRLPDFSDRESLPYINAVLKEVTRWHSVVPLGVSHRVMEEDEYNGFRIPAGSILVPNAWAMSRDTLMYDSPDDFIPERFLKQGLDGMQVTDPERYQFGFGRRICPGRHFANNSLFIIVASLLHVFDIEAPLGEDGQPTRVAPNIVLDYFLAYPETFQCRIIPRTKKAAALIRNSI
ncbi:O-methylsterigmatocystin oxidoreductase [Lenzites betulinus]|nr:O-methylsterigmatocystin oxidoreductase [Lenzites betulinus]